MQPREDEITEAPPPAPMGGPNIPSPIEDLNDEIVRSGEEQAIEREADGTLRLADPKRGQISHDDTQNHDELDELNSHETENPDRK